MQKIKQEKDKSQKFPFHSNIQIIIVKFVVYYLKDISNTSKNEYSKIKCITKKKELKMKY